jgi:hypothetical protein
MPVTVELPPELERRLQEEAASQGVAVDSLVRTVLEERYGGVPPVESPPAWERLVEIGDRMPDEERASFPPDSSESVDRCLYRRSESPG